MIKEISIQNHATLKDVKISLSDSPVQAFVGRSRSGLNDFFHVLRIGIFPDPSLIDERVENSHIEVSGLGWSTSFKGKELGWRGQSRSVSEAVSNYINLPYPLSSKVNWDNFRTAYRLDEIEENFKTIFNVSLEKILSETSESEDALLLKGIALNMHHLNFSGSSHRVALYSFPENNLHPVEQRALIHWIREIAQKHNTQVFVLTHSPYILNDLNPSDVHCFCQNEVKRLDRHKDAARTTQTMSTGEFWFKEGEMWVLQKS